jgi:hypothetical protein
MIRTVGSGSGLNETASTAMGTGTQVKGDLLLVEIIQMRVSTDMCTKKIQKVRPIFDPVSLILADSLPGSKRGTQRKVLSIRIGSRFNGVPGSGSRMEKMTQKNEKVNKFHV